MLAGLNPVRFPVLLALKGQDSLYQKCLLGSEQVFPEPVLPEQAVQERHFVVVQGLLPAELDLRQVSLPDELHFPHCQGAPAP